MIYTAENLPDVDPMMVRQFTPAGPTQIVGGVLIMTQYEVADVGMVDARLEFDDEQVDCSNRIFQITTMMMVYELKSLTVFPSRRWRNLRKGDAIEAAPSPEQPLLYLGNPIKLLSDPEQGISVIRRPEFIIKSATEMGY